MTATTLIENFELIAEAPGGVPKLREMILQLAVRGKLVPQNPRDSNIHHERHEEHEGSMDVAELKRPFPIPPYWHWISLGSAVDYNYGEKAASERIPADGWLLDLEDIEKDTSRLLRRVLAGDRQSTSTKSRFNAGDILFGKLRPYLNKVLVAESDGYCTTEIVPMKPRKGVNPHYVVCALKSRDFLDYTAARSYGMKMPRLGTDDAKRAPFPLPPLAEQKRIVASVDELMKRCDELESWQKERNERRTALTASCLHALSSKPETRTLKPETTRALARVLHNFPLLIDTPESVADLRKTILQLAVQGRLVPQDAKDEPAEVLLEMIQNERKTLQENKAKKVGTHPDRAPKDMPLELPQGWVWAPLGQMCLVRGGKRIPKGMSFAPSPTEHVYIRVTDMKSGTVDMSDLRYISDDVFRHISRYTVSKDDLYVTIAGTIGAVGEIPPELDGMSLTENAAKLTFRILNKSYLTIMLNAQLVQSQFMEKVNQMAQPKLALYRIESTTCPVPPLAEQKRIVAKVNELIARCDALEAKLSQSREDADALAAAFVHQVCNSSCERLQQAVA